METKMPIIIQRISDKPSNGRDEYEVRVNKDVIAAFYHQRSVSGLAQCLRDAADAVDQQRLDDEIEFHLGNSEVMVKV